ncbi:MAG: hypothetical protein ACRDZ4_16135 [Egibacteraceae bacterium]
MRADRATGRIGMAIDLTECLITFRTFNYEPVPSTAQARAGRTLRRAETMMCARRSRGRLACETAVSQLGWDPADLLAGAG